MPVPDEPYLKEKPPVPAIEGCWIGIEPYTLGRNTYVGEFSHISQHTTIGSFTSIGNLVTIGAQKHPIDTLTSFPFIEILKKKTPKDTVIGCDVWVGCNAVIMEGVLVGHGAVIGAGAVVTKDVRPYEIVVGNPAHYLRHRFPPDLVMALLETQWWNLAAADIQRLPFEKPWDCIALIRGMDKQKAVL